LGLSCASWRLQSLRQRIPENSPRRLIEEHLSALQANHAALDLRILPGSRCLSHSKKSRLRIRECLNWSNFPALRLLRRSGGYRNPEVLASTEVKPREENSGIERESHASRNMHVKSVDIFLRIFIDLDTECIGGVSKITSSTVALLCLIFGNLSLFFRTVFLSRSSKSEQGSRFPLKGR